VSTLQRPPANVPFLDQRGLVSEPWRKFLDGLLERTGGYSGELITAGNGIAVSDGPTVAVDGGDSVTWTAEQFFSELTLRPGAAVVPTDNGDVSFQFNGTNNLVIKAKGTDGTVRSVTLVLT
jgi:hypothetical protein